MDIKRLQSNIATAKRILIENWGGGKNETAKKQFIDACNGMEWSLGEADYFLDKVGDIKIAAEKFFSARKHLRFENGSSNGIVVLRSEMKSLLDRVEKYSADLQKKEKGTSSEV